LSKSIIVIGGGIVGAASALRLRAAGFDVLLIDQGDVRRGASFGNAGHIGTEQCDPWPSFHNLLNFPRQLFAVGGPLDFRGPDIARWLPWSFRFMREVLPARVARNTKALEDLLQDPIAAWDRLFGIAGTASMAMSVGHNCVWMSERAANEGMRTWRRAKIGTARFREMTREELATVAGAMKKAPVAGLHFTGTGQVRQPQGVREALLVAFKAKGGATRDAQVASVSADSNGVVVGCHDGRVERAQEVLISAGAWSKPLMAQLGQPVPLIGERGYHLMSATHEWPSDLPPTIFEENFVVVTRFTNGLRATSFLEFGNPDSPPDTRKWDRLEKHTRELGIPMTGPLERWMGPRPTLPDYLPAIGRMKKNPRVLYAFGHQHLGLTMAAITAEIVEAVATGATPPILIEAFRVERFG
jgi:glycine/D-amino acid oxidase-like deaminating enzyme